MDLAEGFLTGARDLELVRDVRFARLSPSSSLPLSALCAAEDAALLLALLDLLRPRKRDDLEDVVALPP